MIENPEVIKLIHLKNEKIEELEAHFISNDWGNKFQKITILFKDLIKF